MIEIRELNGEERVLTLVGRGMPAQPLTLEGTQGISKSRPLGSPYVNQQPTGAEESATTIGGVWNDIFLSNGEGAATINTVTEVTIEGVPAISIDARAVRTAAELCEIVDDIRQRAAVLRFTWSHIVRLGRISKFVQRWMNDNDVEWEIEFEWIGKDEATAVSVPSEIDPTHDLTLYIDGANQVADATAYPAVENIDPTFLEVIDTRLANVQAAILDHEDSIRTRLDGFTTALDVFRRSLAVAALVRDEAELMALEIDSRVAGMTLVNPTPEDLTDLLPGQVLAMLTQNRIAARSSRSLSEDAVRRRYDTLATVEAVAAIYIARQGDDLQSIARFHYGAADAWTEIRDYNHLSSATLSVGQIVLVPERGGRAA